MTKKQKIVAKLLVLFLLFGVFVIPTPAANVQAASQKALQVSYSFNGKNTTNDKNCFKNNAYEIRFLGSDDSTAIKNLKAGMKVYIPKKTLDKQGAVLNIETYFAIYSGNSAAFVNGKIGIKVSNVTGKLNVQAADYSKGKYVSKASTYATLKKGTGSAKNYYVITLKNIPGDGKIETSSGSQIGTVSSSTKYPYDVGVIIMGQNTKTSGKLYIDDVTVKNGSKKILSYDFSSKVPSWYAGYHKGGKMNSGLTITNIK